MSTAPGAPPGAGPVPAGRWRPAEPLAALACGHSHPPSGGKLDETARRLSHEELLVARILAAEGHDVRSVPESRRGGRRPDLAVCATTVEVKSFAGRAERDRRVPSWQGVVNKLFDGAGQAPHVVIVGRGSGLSTATARRGMARFVARAGPGGALVSARVLGDGYDLAWSRPSLPPRMLVSHRSGSGLRPPGDARSLAPGR